jgi:uncharacterized protein (DUF433 family)
VHVGAHGRTPLHHPSALARCGGSPVGHYRPAVHHATLWSNALEGAEMAAADDLIARWIYLDDFYPEPSEARLNEYGINVWALIGHLRLVDGDPDRVARDYAIPLEAVQAALAFYRKHRRAIDARLEANVY